MKKVLLILGILVCNLNTISQINVTGISPAQIQGSYNFTWAKPSSGWGCPDFNVSGTFVQGNLELVDDGTPGTNAEGKPLAQEGCNSLINGTSINGKIAVIYKGACEFSLKALNAQNEGAIGVIIINNTSSPIQLSGGTYGASVNIPVVMIGDQDGVALVNQMGQGPVEMLLGNVTGYYGTNLAIVNDNTLIAPYAGWSNSISSSFPTQVEIINNGNLAMDGDVSISIDGAVGGQVYSNTVNISTLNPGQSIIIPLGTAGSFPNDDYTITYTVSPSNTDEFLIDNQLEAPFKIQSEQLSYAQLDHNHQPISADYHKYLGSSYYSTCMTLKDSNASNLVAQGIHFSAWKDTALYSFNGISLETSVYEWSDVFTDIYDANYGLNNLTLIETGNFTATSNDQVGKTLWMPFQNPVNLIDNQRYLVCLTTHDLNVYLGVTDVDYVGNVNQTMQPHGIVEVDGSWSIIDSDAYTSLGLGVYACNPTSTNETLTKCDTFTWAVDGNTYTSSGTYVGNTTSNAGCDSTVTLDLTILNGFSDVQNETACDSYTWPFNGNTYTSTTTVNEIYTMQNGCDSTYTLNLTMENPDIGVTQSGADFTSDFTGGIYQWVKCPAMTPISGATNQTYTVTENGGYAVIIDNNGCIDTSNCFTIDNVGLNENSAKNNMIVYPNPTNGNFTIDFGEKKDKVRVTVQDISGRTIVSHKSINSRFFNLELSQPSGVYILNVESADERTILQLVVE